MVIFTVNKNAGLPAGIIISNRAGIYFDYNDVVMTNSAENSKDCPPAGITVLNNTHKVEIYPNPTTDELTIKMDKDAYNSCVITNSIGQVLIQQQLNTPLTKVNVKMLPAGLYYITVKGQFGCAHCDNLPVTRKFVKE